MIAAMSFLGATPSVPQSTVGKNLANIPNIIINIKIQYTIVSLS